MGGVAYTRPNIIIVMEIFPKFLKCTNFGNNEYKIRTFLFYGACGRCVQGCGYFHKRRF